MSAEYETSETNVIYIYDTFYSNNTPYAQNDYSETSSFPFVQLWRLVQCQRPGPPTAISKQLIN